MSVKRQASQSAITGKSLRRARNIVKRYGKIEHPPAKIVRRYDRAVTLLAWDALSKV